MPLEALKFHKFISIHLDMCFVWEEVGIFFSYYSEGSDGRFFMLFEEDEFANPEACATKCRVDYGTDCDYWSVLEKCRIFSYDDFGSVDRFEFLPDAISGYRICPQPTLSPTAPSEFPTSSNPSTPPSLRPSSIYPRYILHTPGEGYCPTGYRFIGDMETCIEAVNYLGTRPFLSAVGTPMKGCNCAQYDLGVSFNDYATCRSNPGPEYEAICEISHSNSRTGFFLDSINSCVNFRFFQINSYFS